MILYQPKSFFVKPITEPKKIDLSKHLVFFINEDNDQMETAIPDFTERYIDSISSNVSKINSDTSLSFFERVKKNDITDDEPIFLVTILKVVLIILLNMMDLK